MFTDEWGGGTSARCRAPTSRSGARTRSSTSSTARWSSRSYYKMPAVQTARRTAWPTTPRSSRCRAATSWSRRGTRAALSVIDFSDTANPVEIAYFDRGPINVAEPDRTQPRRALVDVLVQRPGLRHRDRARLRHLRADCRATCCRENEIGAASRGAARTSSTPSTSRDHVGAELQRRRLLLRPGGPVRSSSGGARTTRSEDAIEGRRTAGRQGQGQGGRQGAQGRRPPPPAAGATRASSGGPCSTSRRSCTDLGGSVAAERLLQPPRRLVAGDLGVDQQRPRPRPGQPGRDRRRGRRGCAR